MVLPFEPLLETQLARTGNLTVILSGVQEARRDMVVLPKIVVKKVGFPLIFERKTSTL